MISESWDSRAWPCHSFDFVFIEMRSPGWKVFVCMLLLGLGHIKGFWVGMF